ncbi:MAG: hypothetical protein IJ043_03095 [Clostridia bacterium]|nr:hypothetical protein [Clostridia bacterium]
MAEIKKVKIRIPVDRSDKNNTHQFVAVNGETFLIKRGETVSVPDYVAEVLAHSEEQADKAFEYIAEATENMD